MAIGLPPLGLYIHLPWCERKCPYCDFNSHETRRIPELPYIETLLADLGTQAAWAAGRSIDSIFIGGGTPSLFSVAAIGALLAGIAERVALADDIEVTLEANPGSAEARKFAGFREAGINRLSLGVQSFNDDHLQCLGRIHSGQQAHAALAMIAAAGFSNFNIDLMHGLPDQTVSQAVADLEQAMAAGPSHLSWYQLTIEPNTAFYKRPPALPVEDELADIQDAGERLLVATGYRQYEVSAWSLPGRACRHNLNYWRFGDYLAIGAGAHGKVTGRDGAVRRYQKRRQPDGYMRPGDGLRAQWRRLEPADLRAEFMLYALRLRQGFSLTDFRRATGLPPAALEPELGELAASGLLACGGDRVAATERGARYLDSVIARFLPD